MAEADRAETIAALRALIAGAVAPDGQGRQVSEARPAAGTAGVPADTAVPRRTDRPGGATRVDLAGEADPDCVPEEAGAQNAPPDLEAAKQMALRRLAVRARSTAELRQDLARRQVTAPVIAEVIAACERSGLLDDREFARQWVAERRAGKHLGTTRLRHELRAKGVADAIIAEVLGEVTAPEGEVALAWARTRAGALRGLDRATATRRLAGQLQRRGFSPGVVAATVAEVLAEAASTDEVSSGADE